MEAPGTRNMFIGGALFVLGSLISFVTYSMASGGGVYVVAYGAIAVGAIQFAWGLLRWLAHIAQSPEKRETHHVQQGVRCLLQAMVYIAGADGALSEAEITTISDVTDRVIGHRVSRDTIFEIHSKSAHLSSSLDSLGGQVPADMREVVLKACVLVAIADGDLHRSEEMRLKEIARVLHYTVDSVDTILANFGWTGAQAA